MNCRKSCRTHPKTSLSGNERVASYQKGDRYFDFLGAGFGFLALAAGVFLAAALGLKAAFEVSAGFELAGFSELFFASGAGFEAPLDFADALEVAEIELAGVLGFPDETLEPDPEVDFLGTGFLVDFLESPSITGFSTLADAMLV